MSRCYPFPPPGFVPNEIRDESLIQSVKKGAKEEVKREKKDRKHKKDKKRKERENEADRSKKHRHKRRRKDESANASKKVDDGRGLINNELEFLEKSCLTMEPEHQTSSQNSCDSTLQSNENEGPNHIQSQPLDGRHNDSETSTRILLHNKWQTYPEAKVMMTNTQCFSREKLDASQAAPRESVGHPYTTSANEAPRDASRVCQEKRRDLIFDSAIDISTKLSVEKKTVLLKDIKSRETNRQTTAKLGEKKPSHQEAIGPSKLCRKCPPATAMRFLNLIENWVPDRVESKLTDSEDQEWWLLMKVGAKRHHQVSNQTTSNGISSTVWPNARFLPEADLYALPFTVPF